MMLKATLLLSGALLSSGLQFGEPEINQDFSCSLEGSGGQDVCDASAAADDSPCVWCSMGSFGVCVSEVQAQDMKRVMPTVDCDDEPNDDDSTADDDVTPDDYWKCLKDFTDSDSCSGGGCTWCQTKAGYGVCLDNDAAEKADGSAWFDCSSALDAADPADPTCLQATLEGDEAACEATVDEDGSPCAWCSVASVNMCLNVEQAEIAEQFGGDCSSTVKVADPSDPACLQATLQGDESVCEATVSEDGSACEWCTVSSVNLCLNAEQAAIAEEFGGDCASDIVEDPSDPTCLQATLEGDEAVCESTMDADGAPCEWCSVSSINFCLNGEQAAIAEQFGGDCASSVVHEDPTDPSCLQATLEGDEAACEAAVDEDGSPCEWCSVSSVNLCLTGEQAAIAEQFGGACSSSALEDPSDPSCLQATLEGDEAACEATVDEDGSQCEWCSVSSVNLCLTGEQAAIAEQFGGDCSSSVEVEDPADPTCLQATLEGDEAACEATVDEDGSQCEWCVVSSLSLCLNSEQAMIAEQFGGDCGDREFTSSL